MVLRLFCNNRQSESTHPGAARDPPDQRRSNPVTRARGTILNTLPLILGRYSTYRRVGMLHSGRNSGTSPLILSSGEKELCGPQVASGPHQGDSRGVVGWSLDGRGVPAELQPPRQDSVMVVVVVDQEMA